MTKTKEPAILFVKPKSIGDGNIAILAAAGVIVVQCESPTEIQFTRPSFEISGNEMLSTALDIINDRQICGDSARNALARAFSAVFKSHAP